jgi:GT2 family glycosyltransferase
MDEIDMRGGMVLHNVLRGHPNEHPKRTLSACLGQDMYILPSASLISRKAYSAVGGFDERLIGYEDDDLFLRIFRAGFKNAFVDEALSKWRMHATSASFGRNMARSRRLYFQKLIAAYPDEPDMMRHYTRDVIAPRFTKTAFGELVLAIYWRDAERLQLAADQVREYSQLLRRRRQVQFRTATNLLSTTLCQSIYRMLPGIVLKRLNTALGI